MAFKVPEKYRIREGDLASDESWGNNGGFIIPFSDGAGGVAEARVIASDDRGWEHCSVSMEGFCAPWVIMCAIKDLFWGEDDCVVQYHPPKADYVNFHPNCLHLWRPIGVEVPRPSKELVGGPTPEQIEQIKELMKKAQE